MSRRSSTPTRPPAAAAWAADQGTRRRPAAPTRRSDTRHRTVDTLARLYAAGIIDDALLEAGRTFEQTFAAAALDPLRAASLERLLGNGYAMGTTESTLRARRRLHAALTALGGQSSPAGSACWHVLGLGCSLRAWALGTGWAGRPLRQEAAQGILVAALGVLAAHLGLADSPRAG